MLPSSITSRRRRWPRCRFPAPPRACPEQGVIHEAPAHQLLIGVLPLILGLVQPLEVLLNLAEQGKLRRDVRYLLRYLLRQAQRALAALHRHDNVLVRNLDASASWPPLEEEQVVGERRHREPDLLEVVHVEVLHHRFDLFTENSQNMLGTHSGDKQVVVAKQQWKPRGDGGLMVLALLRRWLRRAVSTWWRVPTCRRRRRPSTETPDREIACGR